MRLISRLNREPASTPSSTRRARAGEPRESRERQQPHFARHGQDSPALLLVVHVQLAERRILRSRACQVDAEVVLTRAAVRGPHAAKNRLGKGT